MQYCNFSKGKWQHSPSEEKDLYQNSEVMAQKVTIMQIDRSVAKQMLRIKNSQYLHIKVSIVGNTDFHVSKIYPPLSRRRTIR